MVLGTVLLVFAAALASALFRDRRATADAEASRLHGQTKVVEDNLVRQLEGVAAALSGVRAGLDLATPEGIGRMNARLALLADAMPGVRSMAVLDAGGTVVTASRDVLMGRNFAHREYFDVPRRSPDRSALYVSAPISASVDGFVVFVSKAIVAPDGRFAGTVAATLNPTYFDVLVRSVLYAPDMKSVLVHGDGKVFIHAPADERVTGRDLPGRGTAHDPYRQAARSGDVVIAPDFASADERLVAARLVDSASLHMDKPLMVVVSRDPSAVFEWWREKATRFAAFFVIVAAAACGALRASQRRRCTVGRLAQQAAAERERGAARLELALRGADLGLWDIDLRTGAMVLNARERAMVGYGADEALDAGTTWRQLVHPDDMAAVEAAMLAHVKGRCGTFDCEHRIRHRDGRWLWVSSRAMVTERNAAGHALRIIGTHLDITERKQADARLAAASAQLCKSEERLTLALEGSGLALFDWDIGADVLFHSAQAAALRGEPAVETSTSAKEARRHVHRDDLPGMLAGLRDALTGAASHYHAEFRLRTTTGEWIWVRARGRVVERDAAGRAQRLAGTYANVNERKRTEERLRHLAEFDPLTDLPNRALFNDRLRQAMARAKPNRALALLFLDVDRFKQINDTLGHEAGDRLLQEFARRMQDTVRLSDTVARLAGDEFTIILEHLRSADDAEAVAAKLVQVLRAPVLLGGLSREVTASIGVAALQEGDSADMLLRRADGALYEAKRRGRNGWFFKRPQVEVPVPGAQMPSTQVH